MIFQSALRSYLLSDTTISGILGTRIYAELAPQSAVDPFCVIQNISGTIINNSLNSVNTNPVYRDIWQIDSYSKTNTVAESLKTAVINRLNIKNHIMFSDYKVYLSMLDDFEDGFEPENDNSQIGYYRKRTDFIIKRNQNET